MDIMINPSLVPIDQDPFVYAAVPDRRDTIEVLDDALRVDAAAPLLSVSENAQAGITWENVRLKQQFEAMRQNSRVFSAYPLSYGSVLGRAAHP